MMLNGVFLFVELNDGKKNKTKKRHDVSGEE